MEQVAVHPQLKQVLVCCNQRGPDSTMPCCGDTGSEVYAKLRGWVTRYGLTSRIYVTQTACLGWCHGAGAMIAIQPDGIYLRSVTPADVDQVIERYLKG